MFETLGPPRGVGWDGGVADPLETRYSPREYFTSFRRSNRPGVGWGAKNWGTLSSLTLA